MFRNFILILMIVSFSLPAHAIEKNEISFNQGVKLFKQKKYKNALKYFKQAYSQGMRKSALYFNIGVSYYKTGNYKKAKNNFIHLSKDRKFRQIAYYNLGLVSERLKQKQQAINYYKKTVKNKDNKKLYQLAENRLEIILHGKKKAKSKTSANIILAFGNDDNITNATISSPSNKSDKYVEIYASIKSPVNNKTNFKGSLYSLNYTNVSTENFKFYKAGLDHTIKTQNWKLILELSLLQSTLNNSSYQSITDFKFLGKKKLNKDTYLALRYRYSNINSQNNLYNYLQGTRHQIRADYKKKIDFGRLRLRYQLELNDRQNSTTANYSPTRHTLRARLKHQLAGNWKLSEEIEYRNSVYGAASGVTRKDNRTRFQLKFNRKLKKNWFAGLSYTHTNNNSNISSEKYTRNNIQLFSRWRF